MSLILTDRPSTNQLSPEAAIINLSKDGPLIYQRCRHRFLLVTRARRSWWICSLGIATRTKVLHFRLLFISLMVVFSNTLTPKLHFPRQMAAFCVRHVTVCQLEWRCIDGRRVNWISSVRNEKTIFMWEYYTWLRHRSRISYDVLLPSAFSFLGRFLTFCLTFGLLSIWVIKSRWWI